ncbi:MULTISPECIES: hypothetical protein [Sphingomonadaceae]|uniref:hypothetical protein n=1 Tax=Sphingomonadaceae TaxID=41297 RepID=UPI001158DE07|nr:MULTISPECIES: hypothetical protein [Sphingomonadaceae]QDK31253.1 hypothetical protein DM450_00225 [Sphingomonas sp. IC081]QSR16431.1 hypothetical protein CA833_04405 [Novosphingobium sp. KA1]
MYTRRDSFAMTPCWFKGAHQPEGRRRREEDGSVLCTCRFCRKEIRSREGKTWSLAEGLDLDALAAACLSSHFSVVDVVDGLVIARYPIGADLGEDEIAVLRARIGETHGVDDDGDLEIRLVSHKALLDRRH